jgi:hypothetical protein
MALPLPFIYPLTIPDVKSSQRCCDDFLHCLKSPFHRLLRQAEAAATVLTADYFLLEISYEMPFNLLVINSGCNSFCRQNCRNMILLF